MPTVNVTGPGEITGSFDYQGITFYGWTFPVVVNGQAGVYTLWVDTNNPADSPGLVNDVINDLTADPGLLDGISMNDPGTGDRGDGDQGDDRGDDGDDDGMVADAVRIPATEIRSDPVLYSFATDYFRSLWHPQW